MSDPAGSIPTVAPELLIASCTVSGERLHMNAAWYAVFGDEAPMWSRLTDEDQIFAAEYLAEAASGSLVTQQVFQVLVPDRDEPIPVLLNFLPARVLDGAGGHRVGGVTVVGEALAEPTTWASGQTQRRRMEMLGQMAMGIAHDFNNLLSGILGYTELLKTTVSAPDGVPLSYLQTIEQAALDGAALVRKIQRYIRQDKQNRFDQLDVASLVEDCISLTRPYWYNEPRRKGISIDVSLDLQPVPPVCGSATDLREVFVNIILNAVQAMPQGGALTVRTAPGDGGDVTVTISDTGTGMSDSVRARIFEPLYTTKGEHGTGMGLAVSYGIIQEHDGRIEVDSAPGRGTCFTLRFPAADGAGRVEPAKPAVKPAVHARVLIVDDESNIRSVVVKLLSLKGHTVEQAASGSEALQLVARQDFDVVFTDLGMPEMSGRELAGLLRRARPQLRIVLLTGHTELEDQGPDVDLVVSKPFKLDHLEDAIRQLVSRDPDERPVSAAAG